MGSLTDGRKAASTFVYGCCRPPRYRFHFLSVRLTLFAVARRMRGRETPSAQAVRLDCIFHLSR